MNSMRSSVLISFAQKYLALALSIASSVIIARLLTPADIGIFSIAAGLVAMAHMLRDFGVGQYLVQEKELTEDRIRAAFGLTLGIAWLLALSLALASVPVASFYGQPALRDVILVLAANFVLIPLGSTVISYLNREMAFGRLFVIQSASALVHAVTSVALAVWGLRHMSLAWAAFANVLTTVILANCFRPNGWPWLPGLRGHRRVLAFSTQASFGTILQQVGDSAPSLVVGRSLGVEAVGLLGRASGTVGMFDMLVTSAVLPVTLPHFAITVRQGHPVKAAYLRLLAIVTGLAWPFFAFLALMAYPVTRLLYGDQWDAAVPITRILCLGAALQAGSAFLGQALLAVGAVRARMVFQAIRVPLIILFLLVLSRAGLLAAAAALSAASVVSFAVSVGYLRRRVDVSLVDLAAATSKSLLVAGLTSAAPLLVVLLSDMGADDLWSPLLMASAGGSIAWAAGILALNHPLVEELRLTWARFLAVIR